MREVVVVSPEIEPFSQEAEEEAEVEARQALCHRPIPGNPGKGREREERGDTCGGVMVREVVVREGGIAFELGITEDEETEWSWGGVMGGRGWKGTAEKEGVCV